MSSPVIRALPPEPGTAPCQGSGENTDPAPPTGSAATTYRRPDVPALSARPVAFPVSGGRRCVARARDFTRATLRGWSLDHCCDDALTVITELTANAVTHALPYAPADASEIWLGLAVRPGHVLCAVADPADRPPVARPAGPGLLEENGRGLHLIDALSERWGWTLNSPAGKTVWALLPAPPAD